MTLLSDTIQLLLFCVIRSRQYQYWCTYSKYLCNDCEHIPKGKRNMHSEQYSCVELMYIILCSIVPSFLFT